MSASARLAGKIALITGGNSGIGLATARRFVDEGAYVYITGRRPESLAEAVELIGKKSVTAVPSDVSRLADLERVFATIEAEKGRLDVVFANAGAGTLSPLGQISEKQFDDTFNTNVKGVIFTVQGALPLLRAGASIILNASTTSIKGTAAFSVYSASKAAVRNLARSWLVDLKAAISASTLSARVSCRRLASTASGCRRSGLRGSSMPRWPLGRSDVWERLMKSLKP